MPSFRIPFRHLHHRGQRESGSTTVSLFSSQNIVAVVPRERISNTCIVTAGETQVGTCLYQHQASIRRRINFAPVPEGGTKS